MRILGCLAVVVLGFCPLLAAETIVPGDEWIPVDNEKNILAGSALDFSALGSFGGPAGSHGWLRAVGGHFAFEDSPDVPRRFVGVNLCTEANFPSKEMADELVARLRRTGYNAIRLHHHDRALFHRRKDGTPYLDRELMSRLDYLLSTAFRAGLYATTDLYVSRGIRWRDIGIDRDGEAKKHAYKVLASFHEPAFRDWATHARLFLEHVNPHTGRRYADEPGLPLLSLVNEGNILNCWVSLRTMEPMKRAWREWLAEKRAEDPGFAPGVSEDSERVAKVSDDPEMDAFARTAFGREAAGAAVIRFAADLEAHGARRQIEFIRSLGAKALVTSLNGGMCYTPLVRLRETCFDWVDTHTYVDHPHHPGNNPKSPVSILSNVNSVTGSLKTAGVAFRRLADRPFTVSEWNFPGPNGYRAVGGLLMGALAAGQDWSGLWRFAYSQRGCLCDFEGVPKTFDLTTDPLNQATERAVLALFLRGDLKPFGEGITLDYSREPDFPADGIAADVAPDWKDDALSLRIATTARSDAAKDAVSFGSVRTLAHAPRRLPTSPVRIDRGKGVLTVTTERTVGGFATAGEFRAGPLSADVDDVASAVWASSLDGNPVAQASRILLVHLTDVQTSGNAYADETHRKLLKYGEGLALARRGRAAIRLAVVAPEQCEVWAVSTAGRRLGRVPCEVRNGALCFIADTRGPEGRARLHYEIVRRSADRAERNETVYWQKMIDAASAAGGGRVVLTPGPHVVGELELKSNVTFEIPAGSALLGATNDCDYTWWKGPEECQHGVVIACGATNIALVGSGTVDGRGWAQPRLRKRPVRWRDVMFYGCRGVRLEGLFLTNPSAWTCFLRECEDVVVRKVRIFSHANYNNDGLDLNVRHALVEDCDIDSDDDGLVFKNHNPDYMSEDVEVRRCRISSNVSFIKFGTETFGRFRDYRIHDCELLTRTESSDRDDVGKPPYPGLVGRRNGIAGLSFLVVDGGSIENVRVSDVTLGENMRVPLIVRLGRRNRRTDGGESFIRGVVVERVRSLAPSCVAQPAVITGVPGMNVEDVVLRDCEFQFCGGGQDIKPLDVVREKETAYPGMGLFDGPLPASAFYIRHARNIRFERMRYGMSSDEDPRPPVYSEDATGDFTLSRIK